MSICGGTGNTNPPVEDGERRTGRLVSLDAFRGLAILGMLLVNNIALDQATPRALTHAAWNRGVHFADLIYPWFLFIVGVAIPYAAASFNRTGQPRWRFYARVINRAVLLVLLGVLIDCSLMRRLVFTLGVLQLIGLAYMFGAFFSGMRAWARLALAGGLLAAHWAVIRFVPIPGVGAGVFTEGSNLIDHLNRTYLQPMHMWGLASVVPTTALVIIGSVFGDMLRRERGGKAARLILGGVLLAVLGWLWNLDLPFNKPVWSASYILYSAGLGAVVLGCMYLLIDVAGWRRWSFPLVVLGMNAIAAYVAPILVKTYILQGWLWRTGDVSIQTAAIRWFTASFGRAGGGWLYTVFYILCWWLVFFWMYRKRVFLKV